MEGWDPDQELPEYTLEDTTPNNSSLLLTRTSSSNLNVPNPTHGSNNVQQPQYSPSFRVSSAEERSPPMLSPLPHSMGSFPAYPQASPPMAASSHNNPGYDTELLQYTQHLSSSSGEQRPQSVRSSGTSWSSSSSQPAMANSLSVPNSAYGPGPDSAQYVGLRRVTSTEERPPSMPYSPQMLPSPLSNETPSSYSSPQGVPPPMPMPQVPSTPYQSPASASSRPSLHSSSSRVGSRRLETITYTFSPHSFDSMVLSPPPAVSPTPTYHISVRVNCFTPSHWVTTVRRGSETGNIVGDFEMGYSNVKACSVFMRGQEQKLKSVFKVNFSDYSWKFGERSIIWDKTLKSNVGLTCYTGDRKAQLAKFLPVWEQRQAGEPASITSLIVYPEGHAFLDDVLMSALILERIRTGGVLS